MSHLCIEGSQVWCLKAGVGGRTDVKSSLHLFWLTEGEQSRIKGALLKQHVKESAF